MVRLTGWSRIWCRRETSTRATEEIAELLELRTDKKRSSGKKGV